MAFFKVGVGKRNCEILLLIICVLTQKWYHIKAETLNFYIIEENYKSMHYSRRYGLKSIAGKKKSGVFCFMHHKVSSHINKK